jgi:hypothetical protein
MHTVTDRELERRPMEDDRDETARQGRGLGDDEPDVLLDVPVLHVEEISLEVDDLRARVALEADVLELLKLHVGVDAELGRVQLTIKGVEAQALLKVRLDNVAGILDRVMTTIDNNPAIVERLTEQIGTAVEGVGTGAGRAVGDLAAGAGSAVEDLAEGVSPRPKKPKDDASRERAASRDPERPPRRRTPPGERPRKRSRTSRDSRRDES